jgi:hypothetical protein
MWLSTGSVVNCYVPGNESLSSIKNGDFLTRLVNTD